MMEVKQSAGELNESHEQQQSVESSTLVQNNDEINKINLLKSAKNTKLSSRIKNKCLRISNIPLFISLFILFYILSYINWFKLYQLLFPTRLTILDATDNVAVNHFVSQLSVSISKNYLDGDLPDDGIIDTQRSYYQQKYQISKYKDHELPFCVVISSYNNAQNGIYLRNIHSVLRQKYFHYHTVFIDDGSTDETTKLVQKLINDQKINNVKIIKNPTRMGPLYNQRMASKEHCLKHEIFLFINGQDALSGVYTFSLLNAVFQSSNSWIVYSNNLRQKTLSIGKSRQFIKDSFLQSGLIRKSGQWNVHPLKAFYNKLFLQMHEQDFKYQNGSYIETNIDLFLVYPLVQMAGKRITYVPQILYILNEAPRNNAKKYDIDIIIKDFREARTIKKRYQRLNYLYDYSLFSEEETWKTILDINEVPK